MKVCSRFKVTVLLYIAQEALVKFANLREKIFPQKFAYQVGEIKKKLNRPVDRKQRYFSRRPYHQLYLIM